MDFIAIDFETANSNRGSACSIGVVKVEDFKVVSKKSFLIKPKDNYFDWRNIEIHGINHEMVKDEPEFDVIYNYLIDDFEKFPIVAHNASFDMSVLRHTLDLYNIPYPTTFYSCTYQLSKKVYTNLLSYKLNSICDFLKINLVHHDALSDANACAEIAINIFKKHSVFEFEQIREEFNLKVGELLPNSYKPSVTISKRNSTSISDLEFEDKKDPENEFFDKNIVFTGTLISMVRKEAQIKVLEIGGKCQNSVNSNTNFVVVGEQDYHKYGDGFKSSKIKKAEKVLSDGNDIELISENQFLEMIHFDTNKISKKKVIVPNMKKKTKNSFEKQVVGFFPPKEVQEELAKQAKINFFDSLDLWLERFSFEDLSEKRINELTRYFNKINTIKALDDKKRVNFIKELRKKLEIFHDTFYDLGLEDLEIENDSFSSFFEEISDAVGWMIQDDEYQTDALIEYEDNHYNSDERNLVCSFDEIIINLKNSLSNFKDDYDGLIEFLDEIIHFYIYIINKYFPSFDKYK